MEQGTLSSPLSWSPLQLGRVWSFLRAILPWVMIPLALALVTSLVYLSSLHNAFQFDDLPNIVKFFPIRNETFSSLFLKNSRWISYWLNTICYRWAEFDPFVYRRFNLLFHIGTGIMLFYTIALALKQRAPSSWLYRQSFILATITAFLFLLHPVQTQTVSYVIQGQLEGLAGLFTLMLITCFLAQTQCTSSLGKIVYTFLLYSIGFFACGTKEIIMVAPLLVTLVDWFFVAQGSWHSLRTRLMLHASLMTLMFITCLYLCKPTFFINLFGSSYSNTGNIITHTADALITPYSFFISQFKVMLHYLWVFIWPFSLSVEYDWKLVSGLTDPTCFIPLMALIIIAIGIGLLLKRNSIHPVGFGALWCLLCLAPRSTILPSTELLVDYKTYSMSAGWLFIIALCLVKMLDIISHRIIPNTPQLRSILSYSCLGILLVSLGILTRNRNQVWADDISFWHNIIENAPQKARAHNNLGFAYSQRGEYQKAIPYYKKAIKLEGETYWDPYNNLAAAYAILGNIEEAIDILKKGLDIYDLQPEGHNNLGAFYLHLHDYAAAEKSIRYALTLKPYYGRAMYNMGRLYQAQEKLEAAWLWYKRSCTEGDLDHELTGLEPYADLSFKLGKKHDALSACKRMAHLSPHNPTVLYNLAYAHSQSGHYATALKIADELYYSGVRTQELMLLRTHCNQKINED